MKNQLLIICLNFILLSITFSGLGNNLQVNNVSLESQNVTGHYCYVEFDISWDNSWFTSSVPVNGDAAWIFIKYSVAGGEWKHATLHITDYTAPAGSAIDVAADSLGAFIHRSSYGYGSNNWLDARLRWEYGVDTVADDAAVEVKVFAIEMVYTPQGNFYVGDGGTTPQRFHVGGDFDQPYLVTDGQISIGFTGDTCLWAAGEIIGSGTTVQADFPTGYNAYYCMKYEISQKQYVDFLNTLTRTQQNTRTETDVSVISIADVFVMYENPIMAHRNGISCDGTLPNTTDPVNFYCNYDEDVTGNELSDGQNIACNCLNWMDISAYADWAGLRPMTELEYEKACRGPNTPVDGEYAWGTTNVHGSAYTLTTPGYPTEGISNMGINTGNLANTTLCNSEPVRCGIFAASSSNHTRQETGAGYYGVMEMSGNCKEVTVTIGNIAGRSFTGLHGDGSLTDPGNANVDHWPGINGNNNVDGTNNAYSTSGVTESAGAGMRGGGVEGSINLCRTSDRDESRDYLIMKTRLPTHGGRLVRIAP